MFILHFQADVPHSFTTPSVAHSKGFFKTNFVWDKHMALYFLKYSFIPCNKNVNISQFFKSQLQVSLYLQSLKKKNGNGPGL